MADWTKLLEAEDLHVTGSRVKVSFPNGRSHRVTLVDGPDGYELRAVVVKDGSGAGDGLDEDSRRLEVALRAWKRNQTARLCGFRLDADGVLVGEATVPKIGLTREELRDRVRALASACDLLEAHLTGDDRE
ncbi:hypothetical protein FBQ97_12120 [Acidobacteria bacterium ACD]|nr:MAG: hypothetical protein EDX89_22490 [Acidobacteriota bacterium]MCE7956418.1 hypothetical protein [Acidobacteria bacterium ACB2]MDL1950543.1 hypothetical protein [Acidobacteria bacterium ACD]